MDTPDSKREKLEDLGKKISAGEQSIHFGNEAEPKRETKEATEDEKVISEELKKEIELMEMDDSLKKEASEKANKIRVLADDEKLKQLLIAAREKGLVYAVKIAKEMNDPFILDLLHDVLAREGYYKNFVKE